MVVVQMGRVVVVIIVVVVDVDDVVVDVIVRSGSCCGGRWRRTARLLAAACNQPTRLLQLFPGVFWGIVFGFEAGIVEDTRFRVSKIKNNQK